jgi:hypothetical protein
MDGHRFDTTLFQKQFLDYKMELGEGSVKYTKNTHFKILLQMKQFLDINTNTRVQNIL